MASIPMAADPTVAVPTAAVPMVAPTVDPVVLGDLADREDLADPEDLAAHRLDPIPESNHSPTCQAKEHGTTRQEDSILLAGSISSVVLPSQYPFSFRICLPPVPGASLIRRW